MKKYPKLPDFEKLAKQVQLESHLKHEYGANGVAPILSRLDSEIKRALAEIKRLPIHRNLTRKEPNDLKKIRELRPKGPRRMWNGIDKDAFGERLKGAVLGRMAGCILGSPVEGWAVARMESWAKELGMKFPPLDFWTDIPERDHKRYKVSRLDLYTRGKISGVPVDDDIMYTLLGLLILEEHGPDFTTKDVGEAWLKYLPLACSAERVALANLKAGIPASKTGEKDNPYCQWIGADIRSDPWGYAAPGWPEMAAELAYRDSYLSHRRNGLYGAMFFSAAISAAFAVDTAEEALRIGLTEIPKDCLLAQAVRWALKTAPGIKNYRQAREAVDKKFDDMANVHTINNACLTVFGLILGGKDFTKVIGETVAMGRDNDCTGATAGSICGALIGAKNIPKHWTTSFGDTIHSYLIGRKKFGMNSVIKRFHKQAMRMHQ